MRAAMLALALVSCEIDEHDPVSAAPVEREPVSDAPVDLPSDPRYAFERCVIECFDREIGLTLVRVELQHLADGYGFVCVCGVP